MREVVGSALTHFLAPLRPHLERPDVCELCINQPGELWIEGEDGWQHASVPWATFAWAVHLGRLLATASQQRLTAEHPLLSACLPGGERVQVVLPPATTAGRVAVSVRRPRNVRWTLNELESAGLFSGCRASSGRAESSDVLAAAFDRGDWREFLALAVRERCNVLVSGATGAGKTTLTRALIAEIDPAERLVTIEDAPELALESHPNSVRLYYSKDAQGLSRLTPKQLLEASLRLRPERILLAELRGEEAYEYLRSVNSGHPGSITSIHASSCRLAFEQLALLVKASDAGREMTRAEIHELLHQVVDVVVQCRRGGGRRGVEEVWWRERAA
jgi:type IV secretion system protein VirB11